LHNKFHNKYKLRSNRLHRTSLSLTHFFFALLHPLPVPQHSLTHFNHITHSNCGHFQPIQYLPSHDSPCEVTPDKASLHTLQYVGRAWEHVYQLCKPDIISFWVSLPWKHKNFYGNSVMGTQK